jgi:hypothetical protein
VPKESLSPAPRQRRSPATSYGAEVSRPAQMPRLIRFGLLATPTATGVSASWTRCGRSAVTHKVGPGEEVRGARRNGQTRGMRLQRGTPVAGVDPETARNIARACHDHWSSTAAIAHQVHVPAEELAVMLDQLADAAYLQRRDGGDGDGDGVEWSGVEWNTTITGGALTMASFLKPISRARAEKLLAGVIERAADYNADDAKLYVITEIAVFGSYVRADAVELGDLDLAVKFTGRRDDANNPDTVFTYADASGRNFPTLFATIAWPQTEMLQLLRNRSGYINVHTEDITRFTDDWRVVYRYSATESSPAP